MRRRTCEVQIGSVLLGSDHPIRVQSMTTTPTMETDATIAQSIRMIEAGCEIVRVTAPSIREAENLKQIRDGLIERGYNTPLVADIHYTPNAAQIAAKIVEKVRINPGNFVDKKKFAVIEYDDDSYNSELDRIRERFTPLVKICKEYGTALRIGTNHGSLSDRILSRYGDTPHGMVESALEFLRIAEDEGFYNSVLSMKSSNALVMVQAYRLLVVRLEEEGLKPYPLHLGVTEAGDGEDGRVKSAVGIGTLLEDGLGDTIRVSLTEEPEAEIPVAQALARRYDSSRAHRSGSDTGSAIHVDRNFGRAAWSQYDPFSTHREKSVQVASIGGDQLPRVFADLGGVLVRSELDLAPYGHVYDPVSDKWSMTDQAAEYLVMGDTPLPFSPPAGIRQIIDHRSWEKYSDKFYSVPLLSVEEYNGDTERHPVMNVLRCSPTDVTRTLCESLRQDPTAVLLLDSADDEVYQDLRAGLLALKANEVRSPVVFERDFNEFTDNEDILDDRHVLFAATDVGGLFVDGFGAGIMLTTRGGAQPSAEIKAGADEVRLAYGILQATRMRMSKAEYISCPSCGRTLFDLQETTAMIRSKTDHLKGIKIGIMGCIVNGPGEMADADFGYVGSGPDKITLYKGQEIVKRAVPSANAVEELIELIREDGKWFEPNQ